MNRNQNNFLSLFAMCLIPAAAAAAVFCNSLSGGFVFSDHYLVEYNSLVRQGGLKDFFNISYQAGTGRFLPLQFLSFGVDYKLWMLKPFGFHLTNLIIHSANAALAFLLLYALLGAAGKTTGKILPSLLAALLFAVHPLACEPVAWISGRRELLSAFFILLSALLYVQSYTSSAINNKSDAPLLASLLVYIVAMLCHTSVSTLPLLLLATEFFIVPGEGRGTTAKKAERLVPFFFTGAIMTGLNYLMATKAGAFAPPFGGSATAHLATIIKIPVFYMEKLFYPVHLCVIYTFPHESGFFNLRTISGFMLILAFVFLLFAASKKNRSAAWFLSWTLAFSLPCMNIIPTNAPVADRFAYLPAIGIFAVIALMVSWVSELLAGKSGSSPARFAPCIIAIALVAVLSAKTMARNGDWRSDFTLWSSALSVEPRNPVVHDNLGVAYSQNGDYSTAKKEFQEALRLNPEYISSLLNLGSLEFRAFDNPESARLLLERAVKLQPRAVGGWVELSAIYLAGKEYQKAADAILMAIRFDPANKGNFKMLATIVMTAKSAGINLDLPDFSEDPDEKYKLPK